MKGPISYRSEFHNYDFIDFSQEFLRRNPDYQGQYAQLGEAARYAHDSEACVAMAHAWGLEIPFLARA